VDGLLATAYGLRVLSMGTAAALYPLLPTKFAEGVPATIPYAFVFYVMMLWIAPAAGVW
jgi:hypothetical protein